jgi:Transposase DDE domain group 1
VSEHNITDCLLFPELFDRPVVTKFDQRQGSSDGGAILLKAADRRLGLTTALAGCLEDERQAGKVQHELCELLTQRVLAIACGYADVNDADAIRSTVRIWPRSPRCRALKMPRIASNCSA